MKKFKKLIGAALALPLTAGVMLAQTTPASVETVVSDGVDTAISTGNKVYLAIAGFVLAGVLIAWLRRARRG